MTPEQKTNLASIIFENTTGETIHYVDEWLLKVGSGDVAPLATDEEVKTVKKGATDTTALQQKARKGPGPVSGAVQPHCHAHKRDELGRGFRSSS